MAWRIGASTSTAALWREMRHEGSPHAALISTVGAAAQLARRGLHLRKAEFHRAVTSSMRFPTAPYPRAECQSPYKRPPPRVADPHAGDHNRPPTEIRGLSVRDDEPVAQQAA
jgi:hypothetical protein